MAEVTLENIVIIARQFNPSIVEKHWLITNGILGDDDFQDGCIYTPAVARVVSVPFHLTALTDRLDFMPRGEVGEKATVVNEKLGGIVALLPHTPYTATGMNFHWNIMVGKDIHAESKRLFFSERAPFAAEFDVADARFGAYLSRDVLDGRLKLTITPVTEDSEAGTREFVRCVFNFHFDLDTDRAVDHIVEILRRWPEARDMAQRIAETMEQ